MSKHAPLRVLFINVGWSEKYEGALPHGNHAWLRGERAQYEGSAEEKLFKSIRGRHRGPIGRGALPHFKQLDVVFTARDRGGRRRIVAFFRDCKVHPHHETRDFLMVSARADDVTCLPSNERPRLDFWPGRMGLRRWALGGTGRNNWPELQRAYDELVA